MPKKRYNAEEIIHKLREADVLLSHGKSVSRACNQILRQRPKLLSLAQDLRRNGRLLWSYDIEPELKIEVL